MKSCKREITKEQYDKVISVNPKGYVPGSMEEEFFSTAQICGYGVYSDRVREIEGKYYLLWDQGSSCD